MRALTTTMLLVSIAAVAAVAAAGCGNDGESGPQSNALPAVEELEFAGAPAAVAVGDDAIWVALAEDNTVVRLDPETGDTVGDPIAVGAEPVGVASSGDTVWVANAFDNTVTRIDAESGEVVGSPIPTGKRPMAIAAADGSVLTLNMGDGTVTRLDAATGGVLSTSPQVIGRPPGNADYAGLAVGEGSVWVVSPTEGNVVRVDPDSNQAAGAPIPVGQSPESIVVAGKGSDTVPVGTLATIRRRSGLETLR